MYQIHLKTFSEIGNMPILRETYATDLLEQSVERFNLANLHKESEPLISSLWNIHKDIAWWNFSFDEGYRRFIELCKQNPGQRRDNLTPEEFERTHTPAAERTSNTTNRGSV